MHLPFPMHLRASPAAHLLVTDAGYIMLPSSPVTPSWRRKRSTGRNVKATAEDLKLSSHTHLRSVNVVVEVWRRGTSMLVNGERERYALCVETPPSKRTPKTTRERSTSAALSSRYLPYVQVKSCIVTNGEGSAKLKKNENSMFAQNSTSKANFVL